MIDATPIWSRLLIPLDAGLHYFGVRSTYILGLQIGLNFVPATKTEPATAAGCDFCRREIELFRGQNVVNCWFFDIYIQGSKKYNFKS
jgi:hypothetical protein